jgi:hypothetical protein
MSSISCRKSDWPAALAQSHLETTVRTDSVRSLKDTRSDRPRLVGRGLVMASPESIWTYHAFKEAKVVWPV